MSSFRRAELRPNLAPGGPRLDNVPLLAPATAELIASRFAALSDPTRVQLLQLLTVGGERSVNELAAEVGRGQANVSKHLGILYGAALVNRRRDGTRVIYRVADAAKVDELYRFVSELETAAAGSSRRPPLTRAMS